MLNLQSRTDVSFVARFEADLEAMMLDHAHCEKKAASTALNLVFRYPERSELLGPMSAIVQEEMQHFDQVLAIMERRGWAFGRQAPSKYAGRLQEFVNPQEPAAYVDRLLMCALIEARSCERFQLLGEHLSDPELREFYRSLFESEARHHATYVKLALQAADEATVRSRLRDFAAHEAAVCTMEDPQPRLHS